MVERDGALIMVDDDRLPLLPGEKPRNDAVRFRTLGCYPLTGAIESDADTLETSSPRCATPRPRSARAALIDTTKPASMEKKKREGYF